MEIKRSIGRDYGCDRHGRRLGYFPSKKPRRNFILDLAIVLLGMKMVRAGLPISLSCLMDTIKIQNLYCAGWTTMRRRLADSERLGDANRHSACNWTAWNGLCLGEANERYLAPEEPFVVGNGVLEDKDNGDRSPDRALLSYGYYRNVAPLLRRMDYEDRTSRQMRRSGGTCQTKNLIPK